jgi:hypothetical protein
MMARNARAGLIAELVLEFVEERVRQSPGKQFDIPTIRRAIEPMLKEAGTEVTLTAADDLLISTLLDEHPFMVRAGGAKAAWKPGLHKAPVRPTKGR